VTAYKDQVQVRMKEVQGKIKESAWIKESA